MADTELMTIEEVATALRLSSKTIRRYIVAGRLPAVRIAGHYRVARGAVSILIALAASDMRTRATVTLTEGK